MKVFEEAAARAQRCHGALDALRGYLDAIRFHQFFQYQAGINRYPQTPSIFAFDSRERMLKTMEGATGGGNHTLGLIKVLCAAEPVEFAGLQPDEQEVANLLLAAGLLSSQQGNLTGCGFQLISSRGSYLLIDSRIHFCGDDIHDVYIGIDSYALLSYMETQLVPGAGVFLDLCCGSGVIGQAAAQRGLQVVSTDIMPEPLFFTLLNRRLNGRESSIEVKEEPVAQTLQAPAGSYRYIACNPPFVAFPDGVEAPVYAKGTGDDGLDMLRMLFDKSPGCLTSDGICCFVADLPGDAVQPHYLRELEDVAISRNLDIDVFIDSRLPAEHQVVPLSSFLRVRNPDVSQHGMEEIVRSFFKERLQASHYYLCTMLARRSSSRPHLRVMNRYKMEFANSLFHQRN